MNVFQTQPYRPTPLARRWIPMFTLFVLHNLEEIILDLPEWGRRHFAFLNSFDMSRSVFGAAVVVLCGVLFALAYRYRKDSKTTLRLMVTFLGVMLAVFSWHFIISLYTRSVQPGVVTAVLFIPFYVYWAVLLLNGSRPR
jgi:uncharacterized membrane protein